MTDDKSKTQNRARRIGERTMEVAAEELWRIIENAKVYLEDPSSTPDEKRRWAKTLADTIGVLRKIVDSQGGKQLDDEDLSTLLSKVPRIYRQQVMRRARRWRRPSSLTGS